MSMTKRRIARKTKKQSNSNAALSFSSYWRRLKTIGWLTYLSDDEVAEIRAALKKGFDSATDPIFSFLALGRFAFDSEGFTFEQRYVRTIKRFAENSNSAFTPTGIRETCRDSRKRLSFTHNGTRYACLIDISDWFDNEVLNLINKAMEDAGLEERFIKLPEADQIAVFVCVHPDVYEAAVARGLIPTQKDLNDFIGWDEDC